MWSSDPAVGFDGSGKILPIAVTRGQPAQEIAASAVLHIRVKPGIQNHHHSTIIARPNCRRPQQKGEIATTPCSVPRAPSLKLGS